MKPVTSSHFDALHGLRGIAALAIVLRHTRGYTGIDMTPSSHLAVDLFFILSGFVIAHAYDERLKGEMSFARFSLVRLIRLYPLYLIALLIGVALMAIEIAGHTAGAPTTSLATLALLLGLFFLPMPPVGHTSPHMLFPPNVPAWSLFFELAVNFFYAATGKRLGRWPLIAVITVSAVTLAIGTWHFRTIDGGAEWHSALLAVPRVCFGFFVGLYMRRYHLGRPISGSTAGMVEFLLLCALLAIIFISRQPTFHRQIVFELGCVFVVFPAMVFAAAHLQLGPVWRRIAHEMGEISYPAYVLHVPLLFWVAFVVERMHLWRVGAYPPAFGPVFVAVIALLAPLAARAFDTPVRRWLTSKLHAPRVRERVTQF